MKIFFVTLFVIGFFSCSKSSRTASDPFPNFFTTDEDWIPYEGILPAGNGRDVQVVLQLMPATPGMDSYYKIIETLPGPQNSTFAMETSSQGKFSVLLASEGRHIIQILNRAMISALMRGNKFSADDRVREDLLLQSNGDHELVLVDENFQEVDPRYRLVRRSDLFTVEGYFTVYDDTTEYYERNTQRKWPVAQFARYDEAVTNYHVLAKERHEGVYLKALSYSIRQTDPEGKERDVLVFKRILHMDTAGGI